LRYQRIPLIEILIFRCARSSRINTKIERGEVVFLAIVVCPNCNSHATLLVRFAFANFLVIKNIVTTTREGRAGRILAYIRLLPIFLE